MLRILLLAGTVLAWSPATARADPISVAILTTAGITAATVGATTFAVLTGLTTAALSLGVSYGLQALTGLFLGRPETLGGVQSEIVYGGDVPFSVPFGRTAVAGQLWYHNEYGNSNKNLQMVFVLSDWMCDGLEGVWIDGKRYGLTVETVTGNESASYKVQGFGGHLFVRFYNGRLGQEADLQLLEKAGDPARWLESDVIDGKCYAVVHANYDDDGTFAGGIPQFLFEIRGARVYDWRKDSEAGGDGDHRWNDPDTYEWTDNTYVCGYNFMRGLYYNGQRIIGMGVPAEDLLLDRFTAAANIADEELEEGGNTEKRYACSIIVPDDAEWRVAVDSFMAAGAGYMVESAGVFGPIAGAAQVPVADLTSLDLLAGQPSQFAAKRNRTDKANAVFGTFKNPDKMWESDSFPPIEDPAWELEDGGEKLVRDLGLDPVYKVHQANRIARIRANETRFESEFTGVFPLRYYGIEPGDWVNFDCPEGGNRAYLVAERAGAGQGGLKFSLRETSASVFTNVPIVIPPIVVIDQPPPENTIFITGFTAAAVSLQGANNQVRPGILLGWVVPDDVGVREVAIEYRVVGHAATQLRSQEPESGTFLIQADIMADTQYEVRARYVRFPDIDTVWSDWELVTTTSSYIVATSRIATDTQEYFDRLHQQVLGSQLSTIAEALATYQESVGQNYQYNMNLQQVVATSDQSFAAVTVTTQVLAAADEAFASQLTVVEAAANGASATGLFKIEAESSPAGVEARLTAYARVDLEDEFKTAGYVIEVFEETPGVLKARIVFEADQFAVKTSGIPFIPFAVIGADTYINKVIIGDEILSASYDEDVGGVPTRGFKVDSDGIAKTKKQVAADLFVHGGEYVYGFVQNNIPNDLPTIQRSIALIINPSGGTVGPGTLFARRSPRCVEYNYVQISPAYNVTVQAPILSGDKWAGALLYLFNGTSPSGSYYIMVLANGDYGWYRRNSNNTESKTVIGNLDAGIDIETVFRDPGPAGTRYSYLPSIPVPMSIRVPDAAIGATFWLWGAGGSNMDGPGGPGGYVKFNHALSGGEYLTIMPGDTAVEGAPSHGFGGFGRVLGDVIEGGGASIVWRGLPEYANILGVAGGGGGSNEEGVAGGPGGLATGSFPSGGNPRATNDWRKMCGYNFGYPDLTDSYTAANREGCGGGGYVGGSVLTNTSCGRGGSNFIIGTAASTTNSASAANANGHATGTTPPGTGEAAYIAGVGESGEGAVGGGLIVIEWLFP